MQKKFVKENKKDGAEFRETFTCNPFFLAILLFILELFRESYIDPVYKLVQSWHLLGWMQYCVSFLVSLLILTVIVMLLGREREVILEEEYLQIGYSHWHFYRTDEVKEIQLNGGLLVIRTQNVGRSRWYHVRKKQREKARRLVSEWAYAHQIPYRLL